MVVFEAGSGGDFIITELIFVEVTADKNIRQICNLTSFGEPIIQKDLIICKAYSWDKGDSQCCPSWEIKKYYKWNGSSFEITKEEKNKRTN
jgi:hypothetical protein